MTATIYTTFFNNFVSKSLTRTVHNSSYNAVYGCLDVGINHWDINSTHPLFGKEKYNRITVALGTGVQAEHIFMEIVTEFHSMDNKGIKNRSRTTVGASLSLLAGWRF